MSSFRSQTAKLPTRYGRLNQTLSGNLSWRATSSLPGPSSARFNSTTSAASASTAAAATETVSDAPGDLSDISATDINLIPEKVGYLKELGLDYGWGPSAMIEYVIEHLHIWGGMPWWASIIGAGVLVRLALLKPVLGAADTSARMQSIKHIVNPLRSQMMAYGKEGNQAEMTRARAELQDVHIRHGVKPWKSFLPLIQIPFGFGCYRVVKGMTSLPVPGLASEQLLWLQDLTVADPYYILPAITALSMHLSFRKGGESGMNEMSQTSFGKMFLYGLPAFSTLFVAFFPSALQLYFVGTGLMALGQSYLLSSNSFRRFANIAIAKPSASGGSAGQGQSEQSKAIRMLSDAITAEKAKMKTESPSADLSFIDRALNSIKESKQNITRDATEKLNDMRGNPSKNPDGSPVAPPRLSEKDLKTAADYEKRRNEEEEWKREERNHARRQAYMQAMENEREKARSSLKSKQR
ncbi:hypothetical protein ASPWEDRAFT_116382 [Aspergillus wentii DTO 134E9]|uniref:Membrane insertase YidC/Oxa/ALB C-terminal domain-containing protein n=1 Tax=Aspergillus wentii DTO 134E9 TaxID=1073089 RepID=A0A1L9RDU0_ASPWE|nr:uncharacterized protein ASPWEDRAFT_116382 [Aspergillus wentii DTO 134E9]OJJ33023.1 hypothetical protein ASPWEDRAFT_116382 [Aspergillus wentii DTO 134E9]